MKPHRDKQEQVVFYIFVAKHTHTHIQIHRLIYIHICNNNKEKILPT